MERWLAAARLVDAISRWFGVIASVSVLTMSVVCAFNALLRYSAAGLSSLDQAYGVFGGGMAGLMDFYRANSNAMGESLLVMFGIMVMLGAPWTLKVNEHVRVDLVYTSVSHRARIWIDLLGAIFFLMPMCLLMIWFTWPWFVEAWISNEQSASAGGLPRWPLKLCLPLGFALVALQGAAEIVKCVAALRVGHVREHAYMKPVQ